MNVCLLRCSLKCFTVVVVIARFLLLYVISDCYYCFKFRVKSLKSYVAF